MAKKDAVIRIYVDEKGNVERVKLLSSSGSSHRDDLCISYLENAKIPQERLGHKPSNKRWLNVTIKKEADVKIRLSPLNSPLISNDIEIHDDGLVIAKETIKAIRHHQCQCGNVYEITINFPKECNINAGIVIQGVNCPQCHEPAVIPAGFHYVHNGYLQTIQK